MMNASPLCPHCGQADKSYKISLIYLESTARLHQHQSDNQPELDSLLNDLGIENSAPDYAKPLLDHLVKSFAPPMSEKRITRRVHPDSMIIFFSLLALLLVFQIATSQPSQLPFIVILLTGSILAYLLARQTIIRRYEDMVRKELEENAHLDAAMSRWMHLYFCSRDKGIFDPEQNRFAPLEQISDFINIA